MKLINFVFCIISVGLTACANRPIELSLENHDYLNQCIERYTKNSLNFYDSKVKVETLTNYFNIKYYTVEDIKGNIIKLNEFEYNNYDCKKF